MQLKRILFMISCLCEQTDFLQFWFPHQPPLLIPNLPFWQLKTSTQSLFLISQEALTVRKKERIRRIGITPPWSYLTRTMKGHSSRREGNVWAPTQLFRSLHSLVARGLLRPLSEVFPFSATYPYVSFSFRPYTSHVSCILSSSASKRTAPSRSHKPYHLKFHWPANKQIAKGQILSPGQWAVIMVGSGKGQEVQRWPKVKKCARPFLSAKNTSEQASESWPIS